MDRTLSGVDPHLLSEFLDESIDMLSQVPTLFIELEKNPADKEIINAIFRPIHSLKGNAAYFGLLKTKCLAHELESILDKIRQGILQPHKNIINALLEGNDRLIGILRRTQSGNSEIDDVNNFEKIINKVKSCNNNQTGLAFQNVEELLQKLLDLGTLLEKKYPELKVKFDDILKSAQSLILSSPANAEEKTIISQNRTNPQDLTTLLELLKEPADKFLSDEITKQVLTSLLNLKNTAVGSECKALVDKVLDDYHVIVSTVGNDPILHDILFDFTNEYRKLSGGNCATANSSTTSNGPLSDKKEEKTQKKTMRVAEETIDKFLEHVGDLIVVREMFDYLQKRIVSFQEASSVSDEFRRINDSFAGLSYDLQKSIMAIRKLPLRVILQKVPRIIREIADSSGKEIDLQITGDSIEVDKSLIETLEAPIIHMVRNAADHGIEPLDKRKSVGKPAKGTLRINVTELPDFIELKIIDDGAGLNLDALKKKGESLGLLSSGKSISDEEIVQLIFLPGVSTAQKVTEISGRGVGMDVVRQNVEKAGGKIKIINFPGKGAEFTILAPKNVGTQIINGFIIRIAEENFILPLETITEAFNAKKEDFLNIANKGVCVMRRGEALPFRFLSDIFGYPSSQEYHTFIDSAVVTVDFKGESRAFGVDEILGIQQIVVKSVTGLNADKTLFAGAAVTGNGKVAMILDMEKVFSD